MNAIERTFPARFMRRAMNGASSGPDDSAVDVQPYHAHQRYGVAPRDGSGPNLEIEVHLSVFELILEVRVERPRELISDRREGKVVRRDQADRASGKEAAEHAGAALEPVVRVGAVEQLVDEEEQRFRPQRQIGERPDANDFREEARPSLLKRVFDPQG